MEPAKVDDFKVLGTKCGALVSINILSKGKTDAASRAHFAFVFVITLVNPTYKLG